MNYAPFKIDASITPERVAALTPQECTAYLDAQIESGVVYDPKDEGNVLINLRCLHDTMFFGQTFMAESYDQVMTHQHIATWKMMDDETVPRTAVCGWRTFGKSLAFKTKAVKSIVYRQYPFILEVGKTHDYAAGETEGMKDELLGNIRIRHVFGLMKAKTYLDVKKSFSAKSWFACDPLTSEPIAFVSPKGALQQVRGLNVRINNRFTRPALLCIDDLEDDQDVLNEELREKLWRWLDGALLKCVNTRQYPNPRTGRWNLKKSDIAPWRVFYMDTLKHEASAMARILTSPDWVTKRFAQSELVSLPDGSVEYRSLVPELVSDKHVQAEVRQAEYNGTMDVYAMEKMCMPSAPSHMAWTKAMFKHYSESTENLLINPQVDRVIIVDPAKTSTMRAAYTAILAAAANTKTGKLYFRHLINRRMDIDEIIDQAFTLALESNSRIIAIETTGIEEWIKHPFENEVTKRALDVSLVWLDARARLTGDRGATGQDSVKRARASMLIPYYKRGYVWHEESLKDGPLEQQMLSYPKPAHWDALDTASYFPYLLRQMGKYFAHIEVKDQTIGERDKDKFLDSVNWNTIGRRIRAGSWRCN